jgi:hypothetical protein
MEAMKKMLAQTAAQLKSNEDEAKASKAELLKVRARRLSEGRTGVITTRVVAKAKVLTHSNEGEATKLIMAEQDLEMTDVRNKREREENNEEQGRSKRAASPVGGDQQEQKTEEEKTSNGKPTDEEGDTRMNDEL